MHTRMSNSIVLQRQRWLLHTLLAFGMVFFYPIGVAGNTPVAHASGTPGGNVTDPVVRAIDIAKPAVVRIYTQLNAQLSVHFSPTKSVTFPQTGSGYILTFSGSGTLISAHGDILTADHVVNLPHDQQLSQPLDMQAAPDVANYINQDLKPNPPVTQGRVTQELTSGQLPSDPSYGTSQSVAFLSTDYTGPLDASTLNSVPQQFQAPVDRIEAESAVNQNDVAIVHASLNNMASVQLGDSSSVQQQDMLTIIGFPGNGDVSNLPTNLLTSSVNQIIVSSIKTTDQGAQVIQVGGNVEHGDSGGPALDSNGNVVGIVSFLLASPDSPGSTAFLQASNSARKLVQSLHLDTAPGPFEKTWSQTFNDYAATTPGHWHKAQQELASIHSNYPQFKAILPYLQYAQAQAQLEKVQQPASTPAQAPAPTHSSSPFAWVFWAILAGAVVIVLAALTLFVLTLRRRSNKATTIRTMQTPLPLPISQQGQNRPVSPPQAMRAPQQADGLTAFGAPPTTMQPGQWSAQPSSTLSGLPVATAGASGGLRPWPCGHMNRPNARYCTICGEPAPPPTTRRVEQ
jgi:S1-C subfamily serine protease